MVALRRLSAESACEPHRKGSDQPESAARCRPRGRARSSQGNARRPRGRTRSALALRKEPPVRRKERIRAAVCRRVAGDDARVRLRAGVANDEPATARVAAVLRSMLHLRACRYEPWPFDTQLPRIEKGRIVLPADEPGSRPYAFWLPADGIELPVRAGGLQLGRFVLVPHIPTSGAGLSPHMRDRALDIADDCGAALAALRR